MRITSSAEAACFQRQVVVGDLPEVDDQHARPRLAHPLRGVLPAPACMPAFHCASTLSAAWLRSNRRRAGPAAAARCRACCRAACVSDRDADLLELRRDFVGSEVAVGEEERGPQRDDAFRAERTVISHRGELLDLGRIDGREIAPPPSTARAPMANMNSLICLDTQTTRSAPASPASPAVERPQAPAPAASSRISGSRRGRSSIGIGMWATGQRATCESTGGQRRATRRGQRRGRGQWHPPACLGLIPSMGAHG